MPSDRVFSVSVRRQLQINQFYMPKRMNAETSTSAQNGGSGAGGLAVFVSGQAQVGGVSAWMRSRVRWPIRLIARLLPA